MNLYHFLTNYSGEKVSQQQIYGSESRSGSASAGSRPSQLKVEAETAKFLLFSTIYCFRLN